MLVRLINYHFSSLQDAHMLAIDDGTNTDYSTGNDANSTGAGFPILQSAPLANYGSVKGTFVDLSQHCPS